MRDLIGVNIVKGIGVGIDVETPNLERDVDLNMEALVAKMEATVGYEQTRSIPGSVVNNNYHTVNNTNNASNDSESLVNAIKELAGRPINLNAPDGKVLANYIVSDMDKVSGQRLKLAKRGLSLG